MGFWSGLAKIAGNVGGSFIGDPMLGNQVVGAIQGMTGWDTGQGGGAGAGASTGAQQANPALNGVLNQLKTSADSGNENIQAGGGALDSAQKKYQAGANGSMEELQSMYNPEISTVLSQYDNAAKSAAEFGARGGGRTAMMAEVPFKKAAAAGQVIGNARAGATAGLADVGAKRTALGAQLTGQATSTTGALLQPQMQSDKILNENSKSLGQGIGGILGNIFMNKTKGGGKGGGGFSDAIGNGGSPIASGTSSDGTSIFG